MNQNRVLKLFNKDNLGEQLLPSIASYDKMKTYYPIQRNDLGFQFDNVTPKKIRFTEENDENPTNTDLHVIITKHKEIKMISDVNKSCRVEVIWDGTTENT